MCGINGIIKNGNFSLKKELKIMNDLIIHRGPDDEGLFTEKNNDFSLSMGMRRLSIIDLENGSQPFYSEDKKVVIVFNGEIYNYNKLKTKLLSKDVNFESNSDTEVILRLYLKYGVESFSYLDGMYAFSIYDKRVNKIFIARDFFGEKPLYYKKSNNELIWASELKSIVSQLKNKPHICERSLELFFSLTYIPAPYTIYKNIHKLEPNCFIDYSLDDDSFNIKKIQRKHTYSKYKQSFSSAKIKIRDLVEESVMSRSISDVPLGTFLSGGVDSSIVSYCLAKNTSKKIDTFSIGFETKKFDESEKSKIVSKLINSNHHEYIINEKSLYSNLDKILNNFDEPFADSSALPTFLVSKLASNNVKVALTGDGGDEVFGGYNKYYIANINRFYCNLIPRKIHNLIKGLANNMLKTSIDDRGYKYKIKKTLSSIDYENNFYWNMISLGFNRNQISEILKNYSGKTFDYYKNDLGLNDMNSLNSLRKIDKTISLEGDMLVKVDRTSMLNSLECRAPFLNKKLWDFTFSLPENFLINKGSKKFILKESFKNFFPINFLEKSKQGFGVPVGDWLRSILKEELIFYCDKKFILKQNLFNYNTVKLLIDRHIGGFEDNTFKVWTFYCFQKWYKKNYNW